MQQKNKMKKIMPQELDVWYLLPAIRKELVLGFIKDYKLSQREAADIIGVTESAVSQYLKSKRASELKFSEGAKEEIKKAAGKIIKDRKNLAKYVYALSMKLRNMKCLCKVHRAHDKSVACDCNLCDCC
jgi:predicted transcriptional regulator